MLNRRADRHSATMRGIVHFAREWKCRSFNHGFALIVTGFHN